MAKHFYDIAVEGDNDMIGDFIYCTTQNEARAKAKELSKLDTYKGTPVAYVNLNRYDATTYDETFCDRTENYKKGRLINTTNWNY